MRSLKLNLTKGFFRIQHTALCILFMTGCVSFAEKYLVYSIKESRISGNDVSFCLKNTGTRAISSFTVYAELKLEAEGEEADFVYMEKSFNENLAENEENVFSFNPKEFMDGVFNDDGDEVDDYENSISIMRLFVKEIVFEDGSIWSDEYGTWSF